MPEAVKNAIIPKKPSARKYVKKEKLDIPVSKPVQKQEIMIFNNKKNNPNFVAEA